jgi:acyl-CoA reductase-like NAD-dependent aldehyde dehydrogenase
MVDRARIEKIVKKVLSEEDLRPTAGKTLPSSFYAPGNRIGDGIFNSIDEAVLNARQAYLQWKKISLAKRIQIIETIREMSRSHAGQFAEMAVHETGMGRKECKSNKNLLAADKTPGPELLKTMVFSGDHGLTIVERAPFGVIASITPTTNTVATIINNTISILSGGNTVVYNVHPRAKNVSLYAIQLLNRTIASAGGPNNTLTTIKEPNIASAQELMLHAGIDLILVTGGNEVVKFALQSGKHAICAGPGNPPVVVDETADLEKASQDIVDGCSFDNNLVCTDEKEVFAIDRIADGLKTNMTARGAYEIKGNDYARLEKVIFDEVGTSGKPGKMNPKWIGQDANKILQEAGFQADGNVRVILVELPISHSLIWTEQMMPVLPLVRVRNVDEGIELALKAEHGFRHTSVIHSFNINSLDKMARLIDTAIFVKNAPSYSGLGFEGEGYTSLSIGTITGDGLTTCLTFTRERRCALVDYFRIV